MKLETQHQKQLKEFGGHSPFAAELLLLLTEETLDHRPNNMSDTSLSVTPEVCLKFSA